MHTEIVILKHLFYCQSMKKKSNRLYFFKTRKLIPASGIVKKYFGSNFISVDLPSSVNSYRKDFSIMTNPTFVCNLPSRMPKNECFFFLKKIFKLPQECFFCLSHRYNYEDPRRMEGMVYLICSFQLSFLH